MCFPKTFLASGDLLTDWKIGRRKYEFNIHFRFTWLFNADVAYTKAKTINDSLKPQLRIRKAKAVN